MRNPTPPSSAEIIQVAPLSRGEVGGRVEALAALQTGADMTRATGTGAIGPDQRQGSGMQMRPRSSPS